MTRSFRAWKYVLPFIIYVGAFRSFQVTGWEVWLPLIYAWVFIPALELALKPDLSNLTNEEEIFEKDRKIYDLFLYLVVPIQYAAMVMFLFSMRDPNLAWYDIVGRVWVMGQLCGVFGINVGHELGHRSKKFEQFLAKTLLLTSLYMHFFIEHNKGHHKRVATPSDPSSARYNEPVYVFYFRSIIFSYLSAWRIANVECRKKNKPVFSIHNEMIRFSAMEFAAIATVFYFFGWLITVYFIVAAVIGILLLETVNYIEHYGLQRKQLGDGRYERALPVHSWNSDHLAGRLMLFELSRHSDHHYMASRKYQVLRHHEESPQMPTGYPGMMLLSLIPPVWFHIMNRRIKKFQDHSQKESRVSLTRTHF
jgi:alkane 1-monooxygenase